MLGVRTYQREFIDQCRAKVDRDVAAYGDALASMRGGAAAKTFEATFFNNMVLVLDACFVHRLRTVEGKDGNALNEVRVLCDSILSNEGVMTEDKSIKLSPEKSVLKYQAGDRLNIDQPGFQRLADAYFAEIERKFS